MGQTHESPSARLVVKLDVFDPATVQGARAEYRALAGTFTARQRATLAPYLRHARKYVADYSPAKVVKLNRKEGRFTMRDHSLSAARYEVIVDGAAAYLADYATEKRQACRKARAVSCTVADRVYVERSRGVLGALAVYQDGKKVRG